MSDTPIQVRPSHTHEEMVESLRKLRVKSGLTALVEAVNRADLGAIVPSELADPINQEALRLSTSRDDAIFQRARAAERERIRLELLTTAEEWEGEPHAQALIEAQGLRKFVRRLEGE